MTAHKIFSADTVDSQKISLPDFYNPSNSTISRQPGSPSGFQSAFSADETPSAGHAGMDGAPEETSAGPDQLKAIEDALVQGRKEGHQAATEELGSAVQSLLAITEEFETLRNRLVQANAKDMVRLAMVIAETIIQKAVAQDHEVVLNVVQKALQAGLDGDEYVIHVNPKDFEIVQQQRPLLMAGIMEVKNVQIKSNPQISEGGCSIESSLGQVDATIEGQLEEIRLKVMENLDNL